MQMASVGWQLMGLYYRFESDHSGKGRLKRRSMCLSVGLVYNLPH
jgi:hypothetical protein